MSLKKSIILAVLSFVFYGYTQIGYSQVSFIAAKDPRCSSQIYIDSITIRDSSVTLFFFYNNELNDTQFVDRISVDSNSIIKGDIWEYKLSSASGINASTRRVKYNTINDSLLFSLSFPCPDLPLTSLEFQESDTSDWRFKIIFLDTVRVPTTTTNISINNFSTYCYKMIGNGQVDEVYQANDIIYRNLTASDFTNTSEYATSAYYLSSCCLKKGKNSECIRLGREVVSLYDNNPNWTKDNITLAWTYGIISDAYANNFNYDSAVFWGLKAIALKWKVYNKHTLDLSTSWGKVAEYYFKQNKYVSAITFGEQNYKIKTSILDIYSPENIVAAYNLCKYYSAYGWYSDAINLAKKYVQDSVKHIDIESYLEFCTILSVGYYSIGNEKMCYYYSQLGYEVLEKNEDLLEENLHSYVNLLYHLSPSQRIKKIKKILKKYQTGDLYYQIIQNLAADYGSEKKYNDAINVLRQCIEQMELHNKTNDVRYSEALVSLSYLYFRTNDSINTMESLLNAFTETEKIYSKNSYEYARLLVFAYIIQSKWKVSLPLELDVVEELMFTYRFLVLNELPYLTFEEGLSLWNSIDCWFYDIYLNHYMERLYDAHEHGRHHEIVALPLMLYNNILFTKGLMLNYQIIQKKGGENKANWGDRKKYKSKQIDEFYRLSLTSPTNVYEALDSTSMAIEFIQIPTKEIVALIISPKVASVPLMIPICSGDDLTGFSGNYNTVSFFDKIWENLVEYMDGIRNVYFSLDGELNNIAIENMQCLSKLPINDVRLHRVSSTKCIVTQPVSKNKINNIALFGGLIYDSCASFYNTIDIANPRGDNFSYLPASYYEVTAIDSIAKQANVSSRIYSGRNGTTEDFLSLSGVDLDIVHLATHSYYWKSKIDNIEETRRIIKKLDNFGTLRTDSAMIKSGILLSSSCNDSLRENQNCIITSYEIPSMDLSSVDLIVLSSCQSGLGDVTNDGIIGLQRAFKIAGAKTILTTLWDVDDHATLLFMRKFYECLLANYTKLDALTEAQRFVRNYTDENGVKLYDNPIYWASFILIDALD